MKLIAHISKVNEVYIKVKLNHHEYTKHMMNYFTFIPEGIYNNPKCRFTKWDGKVRLYNPVNQNIYFGLFKEVVKYLKNQQAEIHICDKLKSYIKSLNDIDVQDLEPYQKVFQLYDYQLDTILECLSKKRRLVESPTSSGKTFITFNILRYLWDKKKIRTLMVVPREDLVSQTFDEFCLYSGEDQSKYCHLIPGDKGKHTKKPIVITTWQSMQRLLENEKKYFKQFKCVLIDEAHGATANKLKSILETCSKAEYRFGFSGTYKKTKADILELVGLTGPYYKRISTKELINQGIISKLNIGIINLRYKEIDRLNIKNLTYQDEIHFIETHEGRNKFVSEIVASREGNTLCLFSKRKHGRYLADLTEKLTTDKHVFYLDGRNPSKERRQVIKLMEENKNFIVFAGYKIFSTGINCKNLHNVVLGSPLKSPIIILQSIGRGLRKSNTKHKVDFIDIVDNLSLMKGKNGRKLIRKYKNIVYRHGEERIRIYKSEKFNFNIKNKDLSTDFGW